SPPLVRRLCCAALLACALAGALGGCLTGCLTTLGPNITREQHHVRMTPQATRGTCMACHESEAQMTKRMKGMSANEMAEHMRWMTTVVRPPLVQDWMLRERRDCVACHSVKEPRA
ncbi:MAG TPA: hypothetical protein VGB85_06820, partial [Nannocystis sp.]